MRSTKGWRQVTATGIPTHGEPEARWSASVPSFKDRVEGGSSLSIRRSGAVPSVARPTPPNCSSAHDTNTELSAASNRPLDGTEQVQSGRISLAGYGGVRKEPPLLSMLLSATGANGGHTSKQTPSLSRTSQLGAAGSGRYCHVWLNRSGSLQAPAYRGSGGGVSSPWTTFSSSRWVGGSFHSNTSSYACGSFDRKCDPPQTLPALPKPLPGGTEIACCSRMRWTSAGAFTYSGQWARPAGPPAPSPQSAGRKFGPCPGLPSDEVARQRVM